MPHLHLSHTANLAVDADAALAALNRVLLESGLFQAADIKSRAQVFEHYLVGADDAEETVKTRLDVYSAQTRPLVAYYSDWASNDPANAPKYRAISGTGSVEEITARAMEALAG